MKINWNIVGLVFSLIVLVIGWGVSVELRIAQHASISNIQNSIETLNRRIQNIEKLLVPVIVDFTVRKELEEKLTKDKKDVPAQSPEMLEKHKKAAEDLIRQALDNDS